MSIKGRKKNIPELLAPAGTKEAFIAAVESGADAIYIGGEILNARMNAANFSLPEMEEAIGFAHKRHVKVYVTVNTLVRDEEMAEALDYCRKLYAIGADALIVQDLGLGYVVRRELPNFPLHMSTQGSVYDLAGVETAKKLGYERVVLARELSLEEIRNICDNTDVPVEVFCHGAICICYSGQCQMSRAIGGRSGNRGGCAQPCRLPYEMKGGTSKGRQYYLSPADMNLIDHIDELAKAGVSSLKIEGRMKSPEYVATVTSIYRKYLDDYRDKGEYSVSGDDRKALTQIFNRGFTTAYLNGRDESFMSGDKPKNKGVCIGRVTAVEKIRNKNDRFIVTTSLYDGVSKNDVLEIGNAHCTVTFIDDSMRNANGVASRAAKDGGAARAAKDGGAARVVGTSNAATCIRIGDVVGDAKVGDEIHRIVSSAQMSEAEKSYKNKDWHEGKYVRRNTVEWNVVSSGDGLIRFSAKDLFDGTHAEVQSGPFEESDADASNRIREALAKTGGTPFESSGIKLHGNFNYKIPMSAINSLRREVLAELEEKLCESTIVSRMDSMRKCDVASVSAENKEECKTAGYKTAEKPLNIFAGELNALEGQVGNTLELYFYNAKDFMDASENEMYGLASKVNNVNVLLPAVELVGCHGDAVKKAESINAKILPYISNVSKGKESDLIEVNFNRICEIAEEGGIYIGNLNWIGRFVNAGVKVFGDYGLNRYNSYTDAALAELGVSYVIDSLESLDIGSGNFGRVPLMTTEHCMEGTGLIDRKGAEYDIVKRTFSNQEVIIASMSMSIPDALERQLRKGENSRLPYRVYM